MDTTLAVTIPARRMLPPIVLAAGMCLAVVLNRVWLLDTRWFYVTVVGLAMVSISLFFVKTFGDFLLISFLFLIPLAGFRKWLFIDQYADEVRANATYSGAMSIGLMTFLLAGFYAHWFLEIFVVKTRRLPRLQSTDWIVFVLCLAHLLSIPGSSEPMLGVHAVAHLVEHFFFYFYLSRHLAVRHFRWIMLAVVFAACAEAGLGMFQAKTGMLVGLILDKGQGGDLLEFQYEVPGIENTSRATGTSYDSHAFGLYLNMLAPYLLVWIVAARKAHTGSRLACAVVLAALLAAVYLSYSRASWLTSAIALAFTWSVFFFWREKNILTKTIGLAMIACLFAPKMGAYVLDRFDEQGLQNLTGRFDQYPTAWKIWNEGFWFGNGAGNYMIALETHHEPGTIELPVHNVFLWLAADVGLVGALAFFTLLFYSMYRLGKLVLANREPTRLIALAALTGLVAYFLDGLTTPLFRESMVYLMFWFTVALSVALPQIDRQVWGNKLAVDVRGPS